MRRLVLLLGILGILLSSCELLSVTLKEKENTPDSNLVFLNAEPMHNANALNGYNDIVGMSYTDTTNSGSISGFRETLRFYQYQEATPDSLIFLGSVYSGVDTLYHRVTQLNLNQYWAVLTQNYNGSARGYVSLVSLQSLPELKLSSVITINSTLDGANANAGFLFVYFDTEVAVYDISDVLDPSLVNTFSLSSKITASAATPSGLFYTTGTGFGYISTVSVAAVSNSEKADLNIRNLSKIHLDGSIAHGGGNSSYLGKSSILKLDLSDPGVPKTLALNTQVGSLYSDFSYDGYGGYYLVSGNSINQYMNSASSFVLVKTGNHALYASGSSRFYTWNGRLFFLKNGLEEYKFQ